LSLAPLRPRRPLAPAVRRVVLGVLVAWLCLAGARSLAQPTDEGPPGAEEPAPAPVDETDGAAALSRGEDDEAAARRHAVSQFHRELRSVEEEVSQLKERVFRSKATLKLLKELVVDAAASGSQLLLWHVNDLGGGYVLESAQYFVDGKNVFTRIAPDGSFDEVEELEIHEQTLPPGEHNLQVNFVLRGKGSKIFSYLESFQFKVQSSFPFTIEEGKVSLIRVVLDSRGSFKNFEDRPTVRYDERKHTYRETGGDDALSQVPAPPARGRARSKDDDGAD